jgi:hypothetical protein
LPFSRRNAFFRPREETKKIPPAERGERSHDQESFPRSSRFFALSFPCEYFKNQKSRLIRRFKKISFDARCLDDAPFSFLQRLSAPTKKPPRRFFLSRRGGFRFVYFTPFA